MIDTHCHLDAAEFDADRDAVLARARAAGVRLIINPAVSASTFAQTLAMRDRYGCLPALGIHPLSLPGFEPVHLELLRAALDSERPVAVGEIGLDFFVPGLDPQQQRALLLAQLRLAREFDLPVLLHVRRAVDAVLQCLRQVRVRGGIAHAFNGSAQQAAAFVELGFKLGFGGAVTSPRALKLQRLAASLPLAALVLETDAPDMPPVWLAPGRNEPGELPRIAAQIAHLRGLPLLELQRQTTANACAVLAVQETQLWPLFALR